jgi:Tol biopolymer transport system component
MDPGDGRLAARPMAIETPARVNPFVLAWSPDAKLMASVTQKGSAGTFGPSDIVIRSVEPNKTRRLSPRLSSISGLYWPSTGSSLIVRGNDLKGKSGVFSVDMKSSAVKVIARPAFGRFFSLSPDGKSAYFVNSDSAQRETITKLNLETGVMKGIYSLYAPRSVNGMAVSPDGSRIGVGIRDVNQSTVALIPVTGGELNEIYKFRNSELINMVSGFTWSTNGTEIVFGVVQKSDTNTAKVDVRALSVETGTLRSLHIPLARIASLRVSRDSGHIAYYVNDIAWELWSMEAPEFKSKASPVNGHTPGEDDRNAK